METLQRSLKPSSNGLQRSPIGALVFELLNSSTKTHLTHFNITGPGSFAAHKALNEFYDEVISLADDLGEQYQGLTETLLTFPTSEEFPKMTTAQEAVEYLKELYSRINNIQSSCPYSEIKNTLDEIKSLINSTKYKLIFLQ